MGFPGSSDGKESTCKAGDLGSVPGWGRSPGERNGCPLQYSCTENSMDRGTWWATIHYSQACDYVYNRWSSPGNLPRASLTSLASSLAVISTTCSFSSLWLDSGEKKNLFLKETTGDKEGRETKQEAEEKNVEKPACGEGKDGPGPGHRDLRAEFLPFRGSWSCCAAKFCCALPKHYCLGGKKLLKSIVLRRGFQNLLSLC